MTFDQALADIADRGFRLERVLHQRSRQTVGLRILDRIGWTRMLRVAVASFWLIYVGLVPTLFRPDLIHPSEIGSDASNYVAAGERLAAGHEIYTVRAGDRPVPLDNAPEWTAAIMSPPTVPVGGLWVMSLPDGIRLYPMWALGLAATIALGLVIAALAPPLLLLIAVEFMPGLAITAWSGNVNALIAPALAAAWFGVRSGRPRVQALTGVVVALATGVKIGPFLVAIWVLAQRRRAASTALTVTGAVFFVATLLVAGATSWIDYVAIARSGAALPGSFSLPAILERAGAGHALAGVAIPAMAVAVAAFVVVLRDRRVAFAVAVVGSVYATTVVRYETVAVAMAAMAPWFGRGLLIDSTSAGDRPIRIARAGRRSIFVGSAIAAAAIIASVATGGMSRSTLRVANATGEPVIARFRVHGQPASFGYRVPAGSEITGWSALGAASPPYVTIWTAGCVLIAEMQLPDEGGLVRVAAGSATIGPVVGSDPPLAPFDAGCAAELKARVERR